MSDRVVWYYPTQFLPPGIRIGLNRRVVLEQKKMCHGSDQNRTMLVEEGEPRAELKRSSMSNNNGFLMVVVVVEDKEEEV